MAPTRSAMFARRRSSLSLLSTRRRSLVVPKSYTFAPNLTPISYPSDRTSPADENTPPSPSASPLSPTTSSSPIQPPAGDADTKPLLSPENMDASDAAPNTDNLDLPMPPPTRPRRRGPRRDSVEHIPRPPNAFMLFRQNFVHQRHVPGSIETNHNSLSRIVGNHWKSLPATEKKRWEVLADKKKEEHKRLYPDYRFQPKHDPEKKRRRQEAKAAAEAAAVREEQQRRAEDERKRREIEGLSTPIAMPIPMSAAPMDEAQHSMQMRRNQERERRGQHFGHRRSSSVPLPMDTYAAYPYSFPPAFNAQAQSNPFNFANPALAGPNQPSAQSAGPIAIPTLPTMGEAGPPNSGLSNLNNMLPSWYSSNNTPAPAEQHSQSAGATPASGELQLPTHLQGTFDTGARGPQQAATLSRAASPRLAHSLRSNTAPQQHFASQQGMGMLGNMALYNQMHMGMNVGMNMNNGMNVGMGARAARQHQLGQLGRRASSTQPILQHQMNSGAFAQFGANNFNFNPALPAPSNVGFTNPFAGSNGAEGEGVSNFPHPFAPQSIWFESSALPSPSASGHGTNVTEPEPLPEVDSYLLNPSFRFGASVPEDASTRTSAEPSAPPSAVNSEFPGTIGPRGSFDFTAIMMNLPGANTFSMMNGVYPPNVDVNISPLENIPPHQQVPVPVPTLAQPVPLRKVAVPEPPSAVSPEEYAHAHPSQQEYQQSVQEYHQHHQHQGQEYGYGAAQEYQAQQEYFQNSQPSSVASGSPNLSATGSGAGSPHGFASAEMHPHAQEAQAQAQNQSQSQESTPTEMHPLVHAQSHGGEIQHQQLQDTVAGTELLDGAYAPGAGGAQEVHLVSQHQQQYQHQGSAYPEPLSASLSGSMGADTGAGALGLFYDQQHHHHQQQQQQQQHGEDLQTYMSAAAGVCSGVDVLDNYALGMDGYGSQTAEQTHPHHNPHQHQHQHGHGHGHAYADPAQGFEFSDFVHDSPYLGSMGATAN